MSAPAGRYDHDSGCWIVPVSDTLLNLFSKQWSEPVQLRAVTHDGGESYKMLVRTPKGGDVIDRLVAAAVAAARPGTFSTLDEYALRNAFEDILTRPK